MSNIVPFHFDAHEVRVLLDDSNTPWWVAKDVCEVLGAYEGIHKELPQQCFSLLDMLGIAADLPDYSMGIKFLAWISHVVAHLGLDGKPFWRLYGAIAIELCWNDRRRDTKPDEFYWHDVFLKHLDTLIPGGTLTPGKRMKAGVGTPDFLVKVENDICPVEIKRESFDAMAVRQLRRYIIGFEAPYGFAVARDCPGILDDNMIFLSLEGLSKEED